MAPDPATLYDPIPVGVCLLDAGARDFPVVYANPAFAALTGLNAAAGADLGAALPGLRGLLAALPAAGASVVDIAEANGRWIKIAAHRDAGRWALWCVDITEAKTTEEHLKQQIEQADAAAEMKANFLATMSHEIRTPMQAVYGLLELINEEKPDAKIKTMVDIAKTSASGLLEILDDILDLAKIDAHKMELDTFEVPVRTLVRGTLEALSVKVVGKNVTLADDIAQDVPFVVIGDPKRLRQILMNLTGNALKFTEKGAVTVRVKKGGEFEKEGRRYFILRFEIVDTGIGMPEAVCKKLFQPFRQADSSTSRKYGGTGLGLSICKKLVELMEGRIGVESTPGQGSTFWFEIPTEEVSTSATTVQLPQLEGVSVLSVEDHPQGAREIVRSLESMGARVESCQTYQEGLKLVRRRPFDVALVDQGLPDGLGIDLVREIMQLRPHMGIIMYTVRDDIGLQHTLQSLGVTYLPKPASRLGLGTAVKDAARKTIRIESGKPARLLIAEDTASVRDVLQRQLEKLGVGADFVMNGREAVKALESGLYGIVFTDLHMPEMDGYDLAGKIRADEKAAGDTQHLPVIVLTADVQMAQRQVYLRHGFDECLLKPVSMGQLRRLLIRWGLLDYHEEDGGGEAAAPVTAPETAAPALDLEAVKRQMGAVDAGAIEMLHLFVDMTAPQIAAMKEAEAHKDGPHLRELAHSLKGSARSAGCNVLGDIAATLQKACEENRSYEGLVGRIDAEFARAAREIKALKT